MAHLMAATFLILLAQASSFSTASYLDGKHAEGTVAAEHLQVMADKFKEQMAGEPYAGDDTDVGEHLARMIKMIRERLMAFCVRGARMAQAHLDKCMYEAKHWSGIAAAQKAIADEKVGRCGTTMDGLKKATQACEQCNDNITTAKGYCDVQCAEDKRQRSYKWQLGAGSYGRKKCNFTDCYSSDYASASECSDYNHLKEDIDKLTNDADGLYHKWFDQHDVCLEGVWTYEWHNSESQRYHYQWRDAYGKYKHAETQAKNTKCNEYAGAAKKKCHSYRDWKSGNHTAADKARREEYMGLCKIMCMLEIYKKDGKFDDEQVDTCSYEKCDESLIEINFHEAEMEGYNQQNGNCQYDTYEVTFGDGAHYYPGSTSDSYTVDYHADTMDLSDQAPGFAYCHAKDEEISPPKYPEYVPADETWTSYSGSY